MEDNIRTHIMNYLEDSCNIDGGICEELAIGLYEYLDKYGYTIIDKYTINEKKI